MQTDVNGFSLAYSEAGQGRPMLLIHGYPLNRTLWAPQLAGLAGDARLIAPDLRGHGDSEAVLGPYSMDLLADDCKALLDNLEVAEPVVVCGLSMGGYIAFAFYRRYPERVAGIVLAATRAGSDSPEGMAGRDAQAALAREQGVSAIVSAMLPKMLAPATYQTRPDLVDFVQNMMARTALNGVVGDLMGMKTRPDSTPLLPEIDRPVLVLHGESDQILGVNEAHAMQQAIPNAQLEVLADAGHLLNLEQPEWFNQAIRQFLQRLP